ncbi:MAG: NADH-quinone oxidoreductase subunit J [bacterium ADurb.Bin429]|nr:MAG: NADH-quinone oxidoreductase subunit J [bacterium ADurb.Bin429]
MTIVFYISAAVAVIATLLVITRLNAVHALLHLIVSLLAIAVIFFALGAPFVAALEVIIYAGAIMVLFVFVIMMLNLGPHAVESERRWLDPAAWVGPGILALILAGEVGYLILRGVPGSTNAAIVGPQTVGVSLFTTYMLGVELASLVLLAGLVGAYHLGRRQLAENVAEGETTNG